jgi:hypothetical protein
VSDKKPSPEDVLAKAPLDAVMDALARVAGEADGKQGSELRTYVADVKARVERVVEAVQASEDEAAAQRVAADAVDKLIDSVIGSQTPAGIAMGRNRDALKGMFHGVPLDRLAVGLRLFSDWLRDPSADKEQRMMKLLEQLQEALGPEIGYDPARAQRERRAQIKADVAASLDEIFRGKPKTS